MKTPLAMDTLQDNHSSDEVHVRGFRDPSDFDSITRIYNTSSTHHGSTPLTAEMIRGSVSHERLRLAEIGNVPVSFIFVIKEGSMQLDEYGTSEKAWLFTGPTSLPAYENKGIEKDLTESLFQYAKENGISALYRFIKAVPQPYVKQLLEHEGFLEAQKYYHMRLEMAEPPPLKALPEGVRLIDYDGSFDAVWHVLEAAFDYDDTNTYWRMKHTLESLRFYTLLCIERASQQPVGTIAAAEMGENGAIATFGVVPSFQRRGIGSHLMSKALSYFWQSEIRVVELSVRINNRQALKIYEGFGFQIVPERTITVFKKEL